MPKAAHIKKLKGGKNSGAMEVPSSSIEYDVLISTGLKGPLQASITIITKKAYINAFVAVWICLVHKTSLIPEQVGRVLPAD